MTHSTVLIVAAVILVVVAVLILRYNRRKARYGISVRFYALPKEITMSSVSPITSIAAGSACVLAVTYLQNGQPFTNPSTGPAFTGLGVVSSDPDASITPASADATDGLVPLNQQFQVSVAATDQNASVPFTISAVDPNGNPVSISASLSLTPAPPPPTTFGLAAAFYPLPASAKK